MLASPLKKEDISIYNIPQSKQNVLLTVINGRRRLAQSIHSCTKGRFLLLDKEIRASIFNIKRSTNSLDKIIESFDSSISCTCKIDE